MKKIILITIIYNILIISLCLILFFGFNYNGNNTYIGLSEYDTTYNNNNENQEVEFTNLKYGYLNDEVKLHGSINRISNEILVFNKNISNKIGDKYYSDESNIPIGYIYSIDEKYIYIDKYSNYEVAFIYIPESLDSLLNIDKIIKSKYIKFECSNSYLQIERFKLNYSFNEENNYYIFNLSNIVFTGTYSYDELDMIFTFEKSNAGFYINSDYIHYDIDNNKVRYYLLTIDNKIIDINIIKEVNEYTMIEIDSHNLNTKYIRGDQ